MKLRVPVVRVETKTIDLSERNRRYLYAEGVINPLKKKRFSFLSVAIFLVAASLVFVWRSLNQPNYGQIAVVKADTSPSTKLPDYVNLTTNYYSLNYSERYDQVPTDITPAGLLDEKILAYQLSGGGQSTIDIKVKAAPYGGIVLDSTYDYYIKHQSQYKMSNDFYRGEAVDTARSVKGQPEITAMWLHNGFLMVIKLTTTDNQQDINTEMNDLLASVQWRD